MKVAKVLSKKIVEGFIISIFLYGTGLTFNLIGNTPLSNPFITEASQVERKS